MTHITDTVGRTARRTTILALPLLVAASGTAAAQRGGMMGGGGSGWGLFGGAMSLWGLLWMVLLFAVPALLVYALLTRETGSPERQPLSVLRERYARGDLTDEEFERRRERLERGG